MQIIHKGAGNDREEVSEMQTNEAFLRKECPRLTLREQGDQRERWSLVKDPGAERAGRLSGYFCEEG